AGIGASFYVLVLAFGRDGRRYRIWSQWRPDFDLLRRLMRFGMPAGAHLFLEIVCFSCFLLLVGRFGPAALAASNVAFNLNSLAFVPMAGLAMAVSVLVGRRIGEGRPELAVRTVHRAFGLTTAYMASFGALYVLAPDLILAPYRLASHGPEFGAYRDTIVVLLRFVALYCMFDGAVLIYNAGLRGAGDTRVPLLLEMACGWTLAFLPTWLVYRYGYETGRLSDGAALLASWTALSVYLMTLGTLLFVRFGRGAWKKMKVIERVAGEEEPAPAPAEAADTISPEAAADAATSRATTREARPSAAPW
ncbi:MAG TPA: MATE family efflux transporter, partial [Planctomycetia bacterium]|nr:MATE family efflux transporter [Planctomycetia bacterium]